MPRPPGSVPPTVYWRRRLLLIGAVLLLALTGYVLYDARDKGRSSGKPSGNKASESAVDTATPAAEAVPCTPSVLSVAARTPQSSYRIGQQPDLEIQVTNIGQGPCVADLSDGQIELLVYNGESRVWSSHDCRVQPGNSPVTLTPRRSERRSIRWSGMSSQPRCAGNRQRVGAGNYTLRARLGLTNGRTTTFSITGSGQ